MCAMIALIAARSNYIYKADLVYQNLRDFEKRFDSEAKVINYLKCALMQNVEISDFYVDGIYVSVYERGNGYKLYYEDCLLDVSVYEKMIIDFSISRN